MKKFKSKKIKKKKRLLKLVFIFFFFFSYAFVYKYLETKRLKNSVLDKDTNYINFNIIGYTNKKIKNVINNPYKLLNYNINLKTSNKTVSKKETEKKVLNVSNVKEDKDEEEKLPIIYLYNTHDTEEYNGYSVVEAKNLLSDLLNKTDYKTIVEQNSMKVFLETNNLKYYKSYTASRNFLNDAINNNPSLKYFIDIHRDSVNKEKSTLTINNKNYAKILFIVGLDNPNNEKNLANANKLNEIIESKLPGISRGVMKKSGKGVNGVYNQDLSENVFLIEIGSNCNTKEEVENTVKVLYEALIEYIRGVI